MSFSWYIRITRYITFTNQPSVKCQKVGRTFASSINSNSGPKKKTPRKSSFHATIGHTNRLTLKLVPPSGKTSETSTTDHPQDEANHTTTKEHDDSSIILEPNSTNEDTNKQMTLVRRQLADVQAIYPSAVILLQVGSFFNIGTPNLEEIASILNLRIGHKGRSSNTSQNAGNEDTRIAGFPIVNLKRSVDILLEHGKTVVIVEQRGRHSKKPYYLREVTRVVTPGTPLEDWEESKENHFLLSCYVDYHAISSNMVGLAWVDVSTGEFFIGKCTLSELESTISRLLPREVLFAESIKTVLSSNVMSFIQKLPNTLNVAISFVQDQFFDLMQASQRLSSLIIKADPTKMLAKRASESLLLEYQSSQVSAAGGLLAYVIRNYADTELVFQAPLSIDEEECMMLDASTLQALEVVSTLRDRKRVGSLLHVMDETVTAAGGRLLSSRLRMPSTSIPEINRRLDLVDFFLNDTHLCDELRSLLKQCKDVERGIQRLHVDSTSPQEFSNVIRTLSLIDLIKNTLQKYDICTENTSNPPPTALSEIISRMGNFIDLVQKYNGIFEVGKHDQTSIYEVGVVSLSFSEDIAALQEEMVNLEKEKIQLSHDLHHQFIGMSRIKTKTDDVLFDIFKVDSRDGPIVDIPRTKSLTPNEVDLNSDEDCKRVSSLGGHVIRRLMTARRLRFIHPDWTDLSARIGELEARRIEAEKSVLRDACEELKRHTFDIGFASKAMAEIDVAVGLAILARDKQYIRPTLVSESKHDVKGGRHPVIEFTQRGRGIQFIKNDFFIGNDERIWLLTGPNMGGKSTFLRQCALMSIMAQAGSFVAADSATLGVVDAIFSRIGAADDLGKNQSTFMVEMEETANILKRATSSSFVIMDEVGRGTSTLDGISIAYAVLVYVRDHTRCRGVFATHYHELGSVVGAIGSRALPLSCSFDQGIQTGIASHHTSILVDESGNFSYIYKIVPGVMSSSHGIEVARLAGLPDTVLQNAQSMRSELETASIVHFM